MDGSGTEGREEIGIGERRRGVEEGVEGRQVAVTAEGISCNKNIIIVQIDIKEETNQQGLSHECCQDLRKHLPPQL